MLVDFFQCFSVLPAGGGAHRLAKPCGLDLTKLRPLLSDKASRVFVAECSCGKRYRVILVDVEAVPAEHRAVESTPP